MELENSKNDCAGELQDLPHNDIWISDLSNLDTRNFSHGLDAKTSSFIVFLREGSMAVVYENEERTITAPSLLLVQPHQKLHIESLSEDVRAPMIAISGDMTSNINEQIEKYTDLKVRDFDFCVPVPIRYVEHCDSLYAHLTRSVGGVNNEFRDIAAMYAILNFFFRVGYCFFVPQDEEVDDTLAAQISRNFIYLVGIHHTRERFLDFYAKELGITAKHLSRTVKKYTSKSAVEWIDMSLIIDAKMLLRTSDMSIKDIASHLNFSSQSFFGKFFKKYVGMSPKEFRKV